MTKKTLSLAATGLWVLGSALAFVLPKTSPLLWLSDALLLIGFWPILWMMNVSWLWALFGVLNFFIGCVLLITRYTGDENFSSRPEVVQVKHHLADYHFEYVWMIVGVLSFIYGFILLAARLTTWVKDRTNN